jgi:exodeoxyribonuclease VII small subunit
MSDSKRGPKVEAASVDSPASASPVSFEDGIKRLSEIVQTLERGDLPLEESLRLFEEGVGLSRASQERLDSAQKRVEELLGFERDGKPRTKDFEVRGERE